jgi:DNA-directed RNA polymerase subunit K/omega
MNPEDEKLIDEESESEEESVVSTEADEDAQPNNPDDVEDSDVNDEEEEDDVDEEEDDDEEEEDEEDDEVVPKMPVANPPQFTIEDDEDDEDEDEEDDENYLQKFGTNVRRDIIGEYHPELIQHNDEEVETLCKIVRDAEGNIIDPLHKTVPFITKYEKARILGERARQINAGAKPFIKLEKTLIDGYLIALREYEEKKIPFIVRRPLPNGGSEYWKLADLEMID